MSGCYNSLASCTPSQRWQAVRCARLKVWLSACMNGNFKTKRKAYTQVIGWLLCWLSHSHGWLRVPLMRAAAQKAKQLCLQTSKHACTSAVRVYTTWKGASRASYVFEIAVLLIFAARSRTEDVYTFTVGAKQAIGVHIISRYKMNV